MGNYFLVIQQAGDFSFDFKYLFQGIKYEGRKCAVKKICGVSILRAGETMEQALSDVCKDIR